LNTKKSSSSSSSSSITAAVPNTFLFLKLCAWGGGHASVGVLGSFQFTPFYLKTPDYGTPPTTPPLH
jgi:hypothetical protein